MEKRLPTETMKVSVAICVRNGGRYLERQLASITAQTRLPDEVVMFDDASTDASSSILEGWEPPFPVRRHRNPTPLGVVRNFEQAVRACAGDLIFLCDQDDVWRPEKIRTIASEFDRDPLLGAVFTDATMIDDDDRGRGSLWSHIAYRRSAKPLHALLTRNVATGATMAFRASWLEVLLPFPDAMLHDEWIALTIAAAGRIKALDIPLTEYRIHDTQEAGAGKPAAGVKRWIESARETTAQDYARQAERLRLVAARVEGVAPSSRVRALRDRAEHFAQRASLPANRIARIPRVMRDLPRYLRYSNHIWSIGRDLLWK